MTEFSILDIRYQSKVVGCLSRCIVASLSERPTNWPQNTPSNSHVFAHEKKHLNAMDEFFKIKNSTIHGWHGSIAEVFVNMAGFGVEAM